jgi:hypothetical protein
MAMCAYAWEGVAFRTWHLVVWAAILVWGMLWGGPPVTKAAIERQERREQAREKAEADERAQIEAEVWATDEEGDGLDP